MKRAAATAALLFACGPGARDAAPPSPGPDAAVSAAGDDEARLAATEKAMNQLRPAAHLCWALAAVDDYRLAGEIRVLIDVDATGRGAVTIQDDSARDEILTDCLRAAIEGYTWDAAMRGQATVLPFAFSAPEGQNVIDRRLIAARSPATGVRVLLDKGNSGNGAAAMFEWVLAPGEQAPATASERAEVWAFLDDTAAGSVPRARAGDVFYLPPRAVRAVAAPADHGVRVVVLTTPGSDEQAVLPASPARVGEKGRPAIVAAKSEAYPRAGVGTVHLLVDPAAIKDARLSAARLEIDAGATIPEHTHDGSTEYLYLLSGAGTMTVDGVALGVDGDSVVQVPPGVPHAFTASAATVALQFYAPPGPEQRFKQAPPK